MKNKEVLDEDSTMVVSTNKYKALIIAAIVSIFTTTLNVVVPTLERYLTSEDKKMEILFEASEKFRKYKDSIRLIESRKIQDRTYEDIRTIHEHMESLRIALPKSSVIYLYYSHDSGGTPVPGSPLRLTVLFSANNRKPCTSTRYWNNASVPKGYFHYNYYLYKSKFTYIPDVTQVPNIYSDPDTRNDLYCNNTHSMMGIVIKETTTGVYYLTVGWEEVDIVKTNYRAKMELKRYATLIAPLINETRL